MNDCVSDRQLEELQRLAATFPRDEFENWQTYEKLLPQARQVLEYNISDCQSQRAELLTNVGRFDSSHSRYKLAEQELTEAFDIRKKFLGERHKDTIRTASYRGRVLFHSAKYEEGEEIMREVVKSCTLLYGPFDSVTRMNMGHLAEMITGQGRFDESEALFRKALEGNEHWTCRDRTDILNADNLGAVLRRKGQYKDAEACIREAKRHAEMALGINYVERLRVTNHLGLLLRHMDKLEEAEQLNRQALVGFEQTLGPEHHFTLQSVDNLSAVLRCKGEFDAAEKLSRRAFEGLKKLLGEDHRHTLQAEMSLALTLKEQRHVNEAADLARDVIKKERLTLGSDHPQIKVSDKALGEILDSMKAAEQVEEVTT